MTIQSGAHWYALQVRPNHEALVASRLRILDITEYVPKSLSAQTALHGKKTKVLIPGYVFCFFDLMLGPNLYLVPGVIRIVGNGKYPTPIEKREMDILQLLSDISLPFESCGYQHYSREVTLIDGPLAGMPGSVLSDGMGYKFVVSLPGLRYSFAVSIRPEWIPVLPGSSQ